MTKAFEKVRRFIERHSMFAGARAAVVAVSGGADSVALLDILVELAPQLRFQIHVAHLDHLLRGKESAADAEFVRSLAESMKLPVTVEETDVRQAAAAAGRGIEEIARELRYRFLIDVAQKARADRIVTGHTMNDQAETFLMRLARGAGSRGLAAIRPVKKAHTFGSQISDLKSQIPHPLLVRPLLAVTREEVEEHCRERGLEFRTDASNAGIDYTRNRVRHEVIASLKMVNPRVVEHISRAAELIANDQQALDEIARALLDKARQKETGSSHIYNAQAYSVAAFVEQPPAIRRRMILEAIGRNRDLLAGRTGKEIESKHVIAVERLLGESMSGASLDLPCRLEVWREFDLLVFNTRVRAVEERAESSLTLDSPSLEAGGIELVLERNRPGHLLASYIDEARRETARLGRDWTVAALDDRRLPETLIIRVRRSGERALVCGQRKIKKLKNLMIDHKIPSSRRAAWPIVATPDGRYIWSPGLPPAVEFAARDETQALAILRASGV